MGNRNFTETMDRGKALAQDRRNRGLPTGKSAKGWDRKRRDPEAGTWDHTIVATKHGWAFVKGDVLEAYWRAVYPERYADESLDQVVTAGMEAERQAIADTF